MGYGWYFEEISYFNIYIFFVVFKGLLLDRKKKEKKKSIYIFKSYLREVQT